MGELTGKEKSANLLYDSALLFAANVAGSAFGFAFHLGVARVGGPVIYADLGTLLSINILLSVAAFSIQTYVAARVAAIVAREGDVRAYLGKAVRKFLIIGVPLSLLIAASTPLAADFLNLVYKHGVIVVGMAVIPLFIVSVMRGGFQGTQRFMALGLLRVVEPSVQMMIGIFLVYMGLGATGAISGTAIGILTTCTIGVMLLKPIFRSAKTAVSAPSDKGADYLVRIALFLTFVTAFTNLDVLLVKHHFEHTVAAQYIAASFMARILFLTAISIGFALFPKTAADQSGNRKELLKKAMTYFLAFAVPFVAFCSLFPEWVVGLFYGSEYVAGNDYHPTSTILPLMLLAYLLIGTSYLLGMYRLSRDKSMVWAPFMIAVIGQVVLVGWFASDTMRIAHYMIGCAVVLLLVELIFLWLAAWLYRLLRSWYLRRKER